MIDIRKFIFHKPSTEVRENLSRSNHPEKTSPTCRLSTNNNAEITEGKLNPNTSVNSGQDMESGLSVISRKPADPQPIRKHKTCPFPSCKVILKLRLQPRFFLFKLVKTALERL